jgi:hypothetical protein
VLRRHRSNVKLVIPHTATGLKNLGSSLEQDKTPCYCSKDSVEPSKSPGRGSMVNDLDTVLRRHRSNVKLVIPHTATGLNSRPESCGEGRTQATVHRDLLHRVLLRAL